MAASYYFLLPSSIHKNMSKQTQHLFFGVQISGSAVCILRAPDYLYMSFLENSMLSQTRQMSRNTNLLRPKANLEHCDPAMADDRVWTQIAYHCPCNPHSMRPRIKENEGVYWWLEGHLANSIQPCMIYIFWSLGLQLSPYLRMYLMSFAIESNIT